MPERSNIKDALKESIKKKIKEELKAELKQELLDEIYEELKQEENQLKEEISSAISMNHKKESIKKKVEAVEVKKKKADTQITVKAILKLSSHALKYANKKIPKSDWVEVIGLLAGRIDDKNKILYIEDAFPMGHGDAIYAEIKDYKNYVRAYNDIRKKGWFICGWYHSHPGYTPFMSDEDIGTQTRYQKLWDRALALVVDPYLINGKSYGFEIYRANLQTHKWFEIPFEINGDLTVKSLPELLKFINPIVDGKAIYLEYDED
ncbi:MAG: Mov34/MPN/PAD-1 family protein [Promethearchaeota archaeon]